MDQSMSVDQLLLKISELEEEVKILREQATVDYLTGVLSPRGFFQAMEHQFAEKKDPAWTGLERRERRRAEISGTLALLDLTGFKGVNDVIGREEGDQVLIQVAHTIKENVRDVSDTVGRYGGDEFAIFFHGKDKKFVEDRTATIRRQVKSVTLGLPAEDIERLLQRPFLVDFHYTTVWIDRKVDFGKVLQKMHDVLKKGVDSIRLAHLHKASQP